MKKIILVVALSVLTLCALGQNQSVGIGTTNPSSRLDVVGSSSTDTLLNIRSSGLSSKVVVLNNGNTGIGVTNPASRLDIKEKMRLSLPGSEAHLRFSGFWGGNNQNYNINIFDDSSDPGTLHMFRDSPGQMAIGNVNGFPSSWGDFSDKLLVAGNAVLKKGNLGIGTGDPQTKLEVKDGSLLLHARADYGGDFAVDNDDYSNSLLIGGAGAEDGLKIYRQNAGNSPTFVGPNHYNDSYVFELTDANEPDPDGGIVFGGTGDDDTFDDIMTVRGNGKVGIGVTTPERTLDVRSQAVVQMSASESNGETWPTTDPPIEIYRGSNYRGGFIKMGNADGFGGIGANDKSLTLYANNNERVRIDQGGNMGIGTTSPQEGIHLKKKNILLKDPGENSPSLKFNGNANNNGGTAYINIQDDGNFLRFVKDGDQKMRIYSGSNGVEVRTNFSVTGNKSAIVETEQYGERKVFCTEAPESRFYDEGMAQLTNGKAKVTLDPKFLATIEQENYIIHLTPYGPSDLYVADRQKDAFVVKAREGKKDCRFSWRLSSIRKNHDDTRLPKVERTHQEDASTHANQ